MRTIFGIRSAFALILSATMVLAVGAGAAFAKKGDLDDKTRPDDDRSSNSGSSSSGSGSSGSSGSSGGSGSGSNVSGGRDGYDRVAEPKEATIEQKFEQNAQQGMQQSQGNSLDGRIRNDRDFGDRFR